MTNFAYTQTAQGYSIFLGGRVFTIAQGHEAYEQVDALIKAGEATLESLDEAINGKRKRLEEALNKELNIGSDITIKGGAVMYKGHTVESSLTRRMLKMIDQEHELTRLGKFMENLMLNPSNRAVTDLYEFLEVGGIPLTEDGCFVAYKAVRGDNTDIHTGKMNNSVGETVSMPRNMVDENPDRTCSAGLHVCSYDYLPYFAHADGKIVICKVNPKDVVAIPRDYNNTKMRVCEYTVIGEVEGWYEERKDILRDTYSFDEDDDSDYEDELDNDFDEENDDFAEDDSENSTGSTDESGVENSISEVGFEYSTSESSAAVESAGLIYDFSVYRDATSALIGEQPIKVSSTDKAENFVEAIAIAKTQGQSGNAVKVVLDGRVLKLVIIK